MSSRSARVSSIRVCPRLTFAHIPTPPVHPRKNKKRKKKRTKKKEKRKTKEPKKKKKKKDKSEIGILCPCHVFCDT